MKCNRCENKFDNNNKLICFKDMPCFNKPNSEKCEEFDRSFEDFTSDCECGGFIYKTGEFYDSDGLNIEATCDECGKSICFQPKQSEDDEN